MNSTEIFTLALGLKEPWEITDIEISVDKDSIKALTIHLGFKRGAKFDDEAGVSCSVHDTQKRTWRHLNFFEHGCHLHCAVPRIRTSDGKVRLVQVPWARSPKPVLISHRRSFRALENTSPRQQSPSTASTLMMSFTELKTRCRRFL